MCNSINEKFIFLIFWEFFFIFPEKFNFFSEFVETGYNFFLFFFVFVETESSTPTPPSALTGGGLTPRQHSIWQHTHP
jgi:hypothetical protein